MKRLFVIGDSISVHYGNYLTDNLRANFECVPREGMDEARSNINAPVGGNGGDSSRVLEFLGYQERNGELNYDILLFNCGLHDIKCKCATNEIQIPLAAYKENLRQILSLLKRNSITPIFVNTTPVVDEIHNKVDNGIVRYNKDVIAYNKVAEDIMRENNIRIIDLNGYTSSLGDDIYCDHVHFNHNVRKLQAKFIADRMLVTTD